ncbi:MAG: rhodanese-like domain-containing protein [Firmicutes bacterium]|uniref:Rhodanese n=1 Tax=Sulfobacillus benefaciens TaxID=453960 RepID=A0A2T2WVH0_9FIRM|nr:rhodanese-like domain-containing protein [Bacillota bacterium]PSR26226.1 MAG: rhodanese [Sulfobacillus benefaciens]HBQ96584.1 rhodanese [Sulfobacillus sp.]
MEVELAADEFWTIWSHSDSDWVVVDVREPEELEMGKIPGAVSMPLTLLYQRYPELPTARPLALVCFSGRRSAEAVEFLIEKGYRAMNVAGGMLAWPGPVEV